MTGGNPNWIFDSPWQGGGLGAGPRPGATPRQFRQDPNAGSSLSAVGGIAQIGGALMSAIGNYYAVQSQQYQLRSQALAAEFEASMANINARQAEMDAQAVMRARDREIAQLTARYGQEKAAVRTSAAGRGVTVGVGSARDVEAGLELSKLVDVMTLNRNAVRESNARRMQAADLRNRSLLGGVSAENARASARSLNPRLAFHSAALAGVGQAANNYAFWRRR